MTQKRRSETRSYERRKTANSSRKKIKTSKCYILEKICIYFTYSSQCTKYFSGSQMKIYLTNKIPNGESKNDLNEYRFEN